MGSLSSTTVPLLLSFLMLFGYVMEMEASLLSPGDYWKSVMHNQPIPKSIAELLFINEEIFSTLPSNSESHRHRHRHHHHMKKFPAPAPAGASNLAALNARRFSRTFDTSPNVIIYHSNVIIN